jgi:hyperosmotically inducible protein
MDKRFQSALFALLIGVHAPTFAADEAERTLGEVIDDAAITAKIKAALIADQEVNGIRINVDTLNHHVTLSGFAQTTEQVQKAESIAANVAGVNSVDNRIDVREQVDDPQLTIRTQLTSVEGGMTRSAGEFIDDAWINAKVKALLMTDERVPGLHINVDTFNRVVTLRGQLTDPEVASRAVRLAASIEGVKSVNDELHVENVGTAGRRAPPEGADDVAITSKVKAALDGTPGMNEIEVETHSGVVTLQGKLDGMDDVATAGEIALATEGVDSVNNQLTVDAR